jgi:DNA-binding transcriptional LysR family regulator
VEFHPLKVFLAVATEKSFSRAAEKMLRTQPAISLAVQRLEAELQEQLIDRTGKELMLTDAGRIVVEYARRFDNLERDLENALAELRDHYAGRLVIGANESTSLYLLKYIAAYRHEFPKIKVQVRRSLSSKIPTQLIDGDLELGVISYDPDDERLDSRVIYRDHLSFVVSPDHKLAGRSSVSIRDLGSETIIAHNVSSPYRDAILKVFQRQRVPLNLDIEMPTVETIRQMVQRGEGVAFLPNLCVEQDVAQGILREVKVDEVRILREIRLVYPAKRGLSHAARAFLKVLQAE